MAQQLDFPPENGNLPEIQTMMLREDLLAEVREIARQIEGRIRDVLQSDSPVAGDKS